MMATIAIVKEACRISKEQADRKSPWFPASIKPAHVGIYEMRGREHWNCRTALKGARIRFWDGAIWRAWEGGPQSVFGGHATHEWRGLADRPIPKGAA